MQIVIDIDNNLYTRLFDNGDEYVADMRRACVAIRKGIVLPKGHGRLIDADELKKTAYSSTAFTSVVDVCDIDDAPTIIEADKAERNDE